MAQYRVTCPNPQCRHTGPTHGTATGGYTKKHFSDINRKKHGGGDAYEMLLLRCPKCKRRWRARANSVRAL